MSGYRRGSIADIGSLLGAGLLTAVVLLGVVVWGITLAPRFKARLADNARNAPLVKKAGELGLTYESVLADPAKAVGKPAVWCLRSTGAGTLYQGKDDKPVYLVDPAGLPKGYSPSHQTCVNALVTIKSVTALDFGGARGLRLEVYFVGYP